METVQVNNSESVNELEMENSGENLRDHISTDILSLPSCVHQYLKANLKGEMCDHSNKLEQFLEIKQCKTVYNIK